MDVPALLMGLLGTSMVYDGRWLVGGLWWLGDT